MHQPLCRRGENTFQLSSFFEHVAHPRMKLLCLGRAGQDCRNVHVVEPGEFCAEIAQNAGIALSTLLANNRNVNSGCTNLQVDEVSFG